MKKEKTQPTGDEQWMVKALSFAKKAAELGEVPVGAVLVRDDKLIAGGGNSPITNQDPTAHAEIIALRQAALTLGNYRLPGTTLYVTLEPCIMCMGAIIHARVQRLVFGAKDPKSGAAQSMFSIGSDARLNHTIEIETGILEDQCRAILKDFFKSRRTARKKQLPE